MEENKDAQNASQDVLDDGNASPSTSQDHVVGDDETAQSTDSGAITNNSTQNHMKQDSVDSYNTIVSSSSSSSSSVEFKEANSGGETAAQEGGEMTRNNNEEEEEEEGGGLSHKIEQKQSHEHNTTSIEKRLSNVSLTSETTPSDGGNASVLRDEEASSLDRTGDRASTAFSSSSSSRRISLQPQDSATSSVVQANGDSNNDAGVSLPGERLSRQSAQPDNTDDESKRSSRINDLETSTMQSVVLSDLTRPTSEALTPSAPTASTSTSTSTDTDNNNKHLSANDAISSTEMKISQTRQSTASSTHNYDLIQQRAEHHHQDLEEHPKRHKRTQRGSEDLRANFDKLREELQGGAGTAGGSSNSPTSSTAVNPIRDSPTHDGLSAGKEDSDGTPPSRAVDANGIDWDFWGEVMNDYEGIAKTRPRDLSKAIQNGIPSALRGMMWQLMSASKDIELEKTYSNLIRLPSKHEKLIIRDLNRTFPNHEFFNDKMGLGQNNLLNIMKAYSLFDDEVGYCQGMAFVVGPLLLNMPDEEAFCVLVRLMKSYDLRSQYLPDMPGLQLRLYQFDRLLEELLPAVFMHLLRQGIKSSMYASQWFLTLLAYRFPLELVCCVFDLIFAEGVEAIFRFALAVMKKNEEKIVQLEFEQVLEFLKTGLFEEYKHQLEEGTTANSTTDEPTYSSKQFVKEALQVKITPIMLDQYTSEWTEMCKKQNEQSLEVEQLRFINKKLSKQVRNLESSLAQINQEHCELVKQVVATRLEKEELEDELVRVKMALAQESLLREEGRGSIASRGSYASFGSAPMSPNDERRDSQLSTQQK